MLTGISRIEQLVDKYPDRKLQTLMHLVNTTCVVDIDICAYFDNANHEWLIKFLENEIDDKNFIRYIKRFLRAGIMENGEAEYFLV